MVSLRPLRKLGHRLARQFLFTGAFIRTREQIKGFGIDVSGYQKWLQELRRFSAPAYPNVQLGQKSPCPRVPGLQSESFLRSFERLVILIELGIDGRLEVITQSRIRR